MSAAFLPGSCRSGKLHSSFEFLKSFYCILNTVATSSKVTWGSNKEHALEWAERMGILRTRKVELFLSEALSIFQLSRCHWCDIQQNVLLSGAIRCYEVSSYQVLEQPQELSAFMLIGAIVAFVLFLSLGAVLFALWEVGKPCISYTLNICRFIKVLITFNKFVGKLHHFPPLSYPTFAWRFC